MTRHKKQNDNNKPSRPPPAKKKKNGQTVPSCSAEFTLDDIPDIQEGNNDEYSVLQDDGEAEWLLDDAQSAAEEARELRFEEKDAPVEKDDLQLTVEKLCSKKLITNRATTTNTAVFNLNELPEMDEDDLVDDGPPEEQDEVELLLNSLGESSRGKGKKSKTSSSATFQMSELPDFAGDEGGKPMPKKLKRTKTVLPGKNRQKYCQSVAFVDPARLFITNGRHDVQGKFAIDFELPMPSTIFQKHQPISLETASKPEEPIDFGIAGMETLQSDNTESTLPTLATAVEPLELDCQNSGVSSVENLVHPETMMSPTNAQLNSVLADEPSELTATLPEPISEPSELTLWRPGSDESGSEQEETVSNDSQRVTRSVTKLLQPPPLPPTVHENVQVPVVDGESIDLEEDAPAPPPPINREEVQGFLDELNSVNVKKRDERQRKAKPEKIRPPVLLPPHLTETLKELSELPDTELNMLKMEISKIQLERKMKQIKVSQKKSVQEDLDALWRHYRMLDEKLKPRNQIRLLGKKQPPMKCFGIDIEQMIAYIENVLKYKRVSTEYPVFWAEDSIIIGPGCCRLFTGWRSQTNFSQIMPSEIWEFVKKCHRLGMQIIIYISHDFVKPLWHRDQNFQGQYKIPEEGIQYNPAKEAHVGVLVINGKEWIFNDCNKNSITAKKRPDTLDFYTRVKMFALHGLLKKFDMRLSKKDPRRQIRYSVAESSPPYYVMSGCSLFAMFLMEQKVRGEKMCDVNKTAALQIMYFDKVSHHVGGHVPDYIYNKLYDWKDEETIYKYDHILDLLRTGENVPPMAVKRMIMQMDEIQKTNADKNMEVAKSGGTNTSVKAGKKKSANKRGKKCVPGNKKGKQQPKAAPKRKYVRKTTSQKVQQPSSNKKRKYVKKAPDAAKMWPKKART